MDTVLLFEIADMAKDVGDFFVANKTWAFLFEGVLKSDFKNGVSFEYETDGGDPYYDLAVMVYGEHRLCIPMPLLTKSAVTKFWRSGKVKIVDREIHDRKSAEPTTICYKSVFSRIAGRIPQGVVEGDIPPGPQEVQETSFQLTLARYKRLKGFPKRPPVKAE